MLCGRGAVVSDVRYVREPRARANAGAAVSSVSLQRGTSARRGAARGAANYVGYTARVRLFGCVGARAYFLHEQLFRKTLKYLHISRYRTGSHASSSDPRT